MFWVMASAGNARPLAPAPLAALLPAAYLITLAANVSRIVLCWGVARVARVAVAERWHDPIHLATGFVVLTFFLIAAYAAAVSAWMLSPTTLIYYQFMLTTLTPLSSSRRP